MINSGCGSWFAEMILGVAWLVTAHLSDSVDDREPTGLTHFVGLFVEDGY